jgi:glycerol-3-phosphate acyltransferase PlsY
MWPLYLTSAVLGYLLGSIPTGYIVGRRHGVDIREHGSGNIGATNVLRVLGKRPGYLVFFCDMLKGFAAARIGEALAAHFFGVHAAGAFGGGPWSGDPGTATRAIELAGIVSALACILGHNFPVWLRFCGGKGVATTVGVLLGLMPAAFFVAAVVWAATFYLSRYVSLASLVAAAVLPAFVWWLTWRAGPPHGSGAGPMFWFSVAAAALVFVRHRANLRRLLNGTEHRFTPKPKRVEP